MKLTYTIKNYDVLHHLPFAYVGFSSSTRAAAFVYPEKLIFDCILLEFSFHWFYLLAEENRCLSLHAWRNFCFGNICEILIWTCVADVVITKSEAHEQLWDDAEWISKGLCSIDYALLHLSRPYKCGSPSLEISLSKQFSADTTCKHDLPLIVID
jgi:hypothetical protein